VEDFMGRAPLTPGQRRLRGQTAAHTSWANTPDRAARTVKARAAREAKLVPDAATPEQRESAVRAEMTRMALLASKARSKAAAERKAQGLPKTITDPHALRVVAAVLIQHAEALEGHGA
jgi:hypothetical protein